MSPSSARTRTPCPGCGGPVAADQRYCLACGARLAPLRPEIRAALTAAESPSRLLPCTSAVAIAASSAHDDDLTDIPTPSPLQSAVAVMSVLAFGVFAGGIAAPGTSFALVPQQPTVVATAASAPAPDAAADDPTDAATAGSDSTETVPAVDLAAEDPAATQTAADDATEAGAPADAAPTTPTPPPVVPPLKHVFLVVLSGQSYDEAFGPTSASPYLAQELPKQGELLQNYYAVGPSPLSNGIALISGQGPTPEIADNCPTFADVAPATPGEQGQVIGTGCVFPAPTRTIGDQLKEAGNTWRAYIGGMGAAGCRHPATGATDDASATTGDGYVTWRNPFAYFHGAIDDPACGENLVDLNRLDKDLTSAATTPSLSYIVPDRCHDGNPTPCVPGAKAGMEAADAYLRELIPKLQKSAAYEDDGLIAITFDGAPQTGDGADSSGCCQMPVYPNVPAPSTPEPTTPGLGPTEVGGGKVGLLLLSKYVEAGSLNSINDFNHFSLLKSLEAAFGLDQLGYAAMPTLPSFDKAVWNGSPSS